MPKGMGNPAGMNQPASLNTTQNLNSTGAAGDGGKVMSSTFNAQLGLMSGENAKTFKFMQDMMSDHDNRIE